MLDSGTTELPMCHLKRQAKAAEGSTQSEFRVRVSSVPVYMCVCACVCLCVCVCTAHVSVHVRCTLSYAFAVHSLLSASFALQTPCRIFGSTRFCFSASVSLFKQPPASPPSPYLSPTLSLPSLHTCSPHYSRHLNEIARRLQLSPILGTMATLKF